MKRTTLRRSAGIAAAAISLSVSLAACSSSDSDDTASDDTAASTAPETSDAAPTEDAPASEDAGTATTGDEFGDGCVAVPTDGPGSFAGMVQDPVGTAASNNPVLSTLVTAVTAADLVDTLNSAEALTVFAPSNDAFAAVPADQLQSLLADKDTLTKVLTHHVLGTRLDPTAVVGKQDTLAGDTVTVKGDTDGMTVDGANVICGNVQTANATVYIIDKVLV